MSEILDKIHNYLTEEYGLDEKTITAYDSSSVYIAEEIALFAHRNQLRDSGHDYVDHPYRCLNHYRNLVGIVPDDYFCIDVDLMTKCGIPFDGVQEVCLLHDVLEDTDVTLKDIEEVYTELNLKSVFKYDIERPLLYITHDKTVPYEDYIKITMKHPVSAIVKMIDMIDNTNLLDLSDLDEDKLARCKRYLDYAKKINDKYAFIQNAAVYNKIFKDNRSKNQEDD